LEGDRMDQKELIKLIEQWESTEPNIYKTNIKKIANDKGIKPRHIEASLNVINTTARSYTNVNHPAKIEFLTALKLAELLETEIEKFLENI